MRSGRSRQSTESATSVIPVAARSNHSSNPEILKTSSLQNSHIELLGIFFMLWGLLTILVGTSTLALGVAAAALINSAGREGAGFAAGVTAATFTMLALIAVGWGGAHVIVGLSLRRLRHWSRLVALSLGIVDLLLLPYGTAVGIYALWVLLREDAKLRFR
jgi:hypothetical protein